MKFKIKFTIRHVFRYLYVFLILANFVVLYSIVNFAKEYVYQAIIMDQNELMQASRGVGDINVEKFEAIIKKIEQKSIH
ncbi:hypothetical protein KAR28_01550 [Candidatus Parcubacteria bacterium]|nr:hypothetical protein [Candidatus Parcubacteria bacterium]